MSLLICFSSEEMKLEPKMNGLFTWNDPLDKHILKWTCAEGEGEHDLMRVSRQFLAMVILSEQL